MNWGKSRLIRFMSNICHERKKGWLNGLLIGDMSQPRGGPMLSEHTSHQIGLDVDIWFAPMPDHVQSREERELGPATDVVAPDLRDVDRKLWIHGHTALIRAAAQVPVVVRILVNAAIKKALCREAGADRPGFTRCVPGMVTPSIFMSKSPVRQTVRNASRQPRRAQATAAAASRLLVQGIRRCTRRRANRTGFDAGRVAPRVQADRQSAVIVDAASPGK